MNLAETHWFRGDLLSSKSTRAHPPTHEEFDQAREGYFKNNPEARVLPSLPPRELRTALLPHEVKDYIISRFK